MGAHRIMLHMFWLNNELCNFAHESIYARARMRRNK